MNDLIAEVLDFVRAFWTRRWLGLSVAAVAFVVAGVALAFYPNRYEATARVYVDTQSVLQPLMNGLTVQPDVSQQISMLARTLISRPTVEKLVDDPGTKYTFKSEIERAREVDHLVKQIRLTGGGRENLFSISFRDENPERARAVVKTLVEIFVASGKGDKQRDTAEARRFIDEQITSYEKKLEEAENRLKEFKLKHIGFTGGAGQDSFQRMGVLQDDLNRARLELRSAEQSRDSLRRQLAGEEVDPVNAALVGASPETEARIDALRRQLDDLLRRFTDEHPDVVATRRQLAGAEQARAQEIDQRRRAQTDQTAGRAPSNNNPVLQRIKIALAESEASVASLRARAGELQGRLDEMRATAARFPQIEAELAQLNRDYDIIKRNYEGLVQRREQASMAQEVDTSSGVAGFRIVEPAYVKPEPVFPSRLVLSLLLMLAALGVGVGMTFILTQWRPAVNDTRTLKTVGGRPVLGAISLVLSPLQARDERREHMAFGAALFALLALYAAWVVFLARQSPS